MLWLFIWYNAIYSIPVCVWVGVFVLVFVRTVAHVCVWGYVCVCMRVWVYVCVCMHVCVGGVGGGQE